MTSIRLRPEATAEQVLAILCETFEARDYHWEQTDARHATAIEGVASAPGAELRAPGRLRVMISVGPDAERLVLERDIVDAEFPVRAARHGAWLRLRFRVPSPVLQDHRCRTRRYRGSRSAVTSRGAFGAGCTTTTGNRGIA